MTQPLELPLPPTPKEIEELVNTHQQFTEPLRTRMERDWELAVLEPFDAGEDYQSYTSNEPMTYKNKIVSLLASGQMKIRIPAAEARKAERERQDGKERFIIGLLKANDERLEDLGQPALLSQLSAFVCIRGWFCGRAMFVRDLETEEVYVDITPFDPLHTSWGFSGRGLKWICLKSKKARDEIEEEYGITLDSSANIRQRDARGRFTADSDEQGIDVYDWIDDVYSAVVVNGQFVKEPTPHGSPKTPAFVGSVGWLPLIQSRNLGRKNNIVHHGESIFEATRDLYPKMNLVYSTMLQLVALSRNQAWTFTSASGKKTLEENPSLEGSQTPLATDESIDIIPLLEMSKDTGAFLGVIAGEVQRGALPYSVYGQLAFQLSGYAVNLLRQATDAPVVPRQLAVESAFRQIANLISDQFATRAFGSIELSGRDKNRAWFEEEFTPEAIIGLPVPEVTLIVSTPQDALQRFEIALQADAAKLLPRRVIWDEILERQDTDQLARIIKEERSEEFLPAAQMYSIGSALFTMSGAAELGIDHPDVDQDALTLSGLYGQAAAMMDFTGQLGQVGQNQGTPESPNGLNPTTLSAPDQGAPVPEPTDQSGPNVPAGSPRPGAREGG